MSLVTSIPDGQVLLALPPEELAFYLLQEVSPQGLAGRNFHLPAIINDVQGVAGRPPTYPPQLLGQIEIAIMEAWQWLQNQILIVPAPGVNGQNGWCVLGKRARGLQTAEQFKTFRQSAAFPKELLHQSIAERAWIAVMRGEFDAAVFFSFKAVEVAVREAGAFASTDIGAPLMRRAFDPTNGPLTRMTDPMAEREALSNLFAGAIGSYKNPHSHRNVAITE
jgi:uncharacterized protein (TIGR02391 family)